MKSDLVFDQTIKYCSCPLFKICTVQLGLAGLPLWGASNRRSDPQCWPFSIFLVVPSLFPQILCHETVSYVRKSVFC